MYVDLVLKYTYVSTHDVVVPQSSFSLSLSHILTSLSPSSLQSHLKTLKRDLTAHWIDRVLSQPVSASSQEEHKLSQFLLPPESLGDNARLTNLTVVLAFLSDHLFPLLPPDHSFVQSLAQSITSSILNNLLIPSLPTSFDHLPPFVDLVRRAVEFEDTWVVGRLGSSQTPVREWAAAVSAHYERGRRVAILNTAREVIILGDEEEPAFYAEVDVVVPRVGLGVGLGIANVVPVQDGFTPAEGNEERVRTEEGNKENGQENSEVDEDATGDGWGFDEDEDEDVEVKEDQEMEPDPADAWGWNDDEDDVPPPEEEDDDPWADAANKENADLNPPEPPVDSPNPKRPPKAKPSLASLTVPSSSTLLKEVSPTVPVPKERYLVSGHIRRVVGMVRDILEEGIEFVGCDLFESLSQLVDLSTATEQGQHLFQCAPSILDLYRAVYPVKHSVGEASNAMKFSNDCLFLSEEVGKIVAECKDRLVAPDQVKERLEECGKRLEILGSSWFGDTIVRICTLPMILLLTFILLKMFRTNRDWKWMRY